MADRLGFVGLGVIGSRMARRLLDVDGQLTVQTRTEAHLRPLAEAGARVAATPAAVARSSDVVFSCLLNSAVIERVYLGEDGLLSAARAGHTFVEHGTFSPGLARRIAAAARERGAAFLDAPVTGGPEGASAGTLVVMVGGPLEALEPIRGALGACAHAVIHVGPS